MNVKVRNTTIAIILAVISTLILTSYLNTLKAEITDGSEIVKVYVATSPIPAGTGGAELLLKAELTEIPKRYIAADSITSEADIKEKSLVVSMTEGEQLTKNKLRRESVSDVSYLISGDKVAISFPVDEVIGVAGNLKTGDKIMILTTLSPGPGGKDVTKIMLSGVEILQLSGDSKTNGKVQASGGVKKTVTIAVTAAQAEKVVFAQETGKLWVALLPADGTNSVGNSSGQTIDTLFK